MKLVLAVLAIAAACSRGADDRIAREYRELWDARGPAFVRTPCPDAAAKRARLTPLLELADDAVTTWRRFDQPLPPALADRLAAVAHVPSAPDDLRCLMADPESRGSGWTTMTSMTALLTHKGENTDGDAGWRLIVDALRVYRDPPVPVYIHFFQPAWILRRAVAVADRHPPTGAMRDELLATAVAAAMPKATLCAGLDEELLAHGASLFYGHVADLGAAFVEQWGPELDGLYTDEYAKRTRPSYEVWSSFRGLKELVSRDCPTKSTAELRQELTKLVAAKQQVALAEVMLSRLDSYEQVHAAATELRARLASAPL